ncbi:MAG: hypothetical protein HGA80_06750 [Candidatus Omnitrophica bacterium]|nr:hypothetical protein [Candidatus Omnitrophota bacterium]
MPLAQILSKKQHYPGHACFLCPFFGCFNSAIFTIRIKSVTVNDNDPVFPQTNIIHGKNNEFVNSGLKPVVWANANPIRRIFKEACANAGLEYYNPHSFRATLTRLGQQLCRTPEEFKVWSQNLGHTEVMTTFLNYGKLPEHRQGELINPDFSLEKSGFIPTRITRITKEADHLAMICL